MMHHMSSEEIRKQFSAFFEKRDHTVVPSSSLVPDDPSVLLTTAGMQQFKPYFIGKADPMRDFGSKNTTSVQKCFRTSDIDEVGDESHLTFFEMLGHFSFGEYFKKETIEWTYELLTKIFDISPDRISATVFVGDDNIPFDQESYEAWSKLLPPDHIRKGPRADNVWGPAGPEGPCGAANEVYVDNLEVATLVFMEYNCARDGKLTLLPQKGVDVGWGFERLVMIVQKAQTVFDTDLLMPLMALIPTDDLRIKRIIADHIRGAVQLIADGVEPSNKDRGYILRRLLRRAAFHAIDIASEQAAIPLGLTTPKSWNERASLKEVASLAIDLSYFKISETKDLVFAAIDKEVNFFELLKSRKELRDLMQTYHKSNKRLISGEDAFRLFSTFGVPIDYIKDEAAKNALEVDVNGWEEARRKHQEISRAGQEKKFGGHGLLLDTGELKAADERELKIVTRLHTSTHLLQAALRAVLGEGVKQMGSDITAERTRFDFTFERKLTPEEIKKVEDWVNDVVQKDVPMQYKEMTYDEAKKTGALHFFKEKYPEKVKVYFAGDSLEKAYSKEFCGGPHVTHTGEIGKFRIAREESVGAGVRRIRGVVE